MWRLWKFSLAKLCVCFLLYEMKQRNIPNRNRERDQPLTLCHAPWLVYCPLPHVWCVVASNLESNPGWGIQSQTKDWSNEICLLWVPLLFSCLKSYSCVHQLITSCPPFHFFTLFVTSIFSGHFALHIAPSLFSIFFLYCVSFIFLCIHGLFVLFTFFILD